MKREILSEKPKIEIINDDCLNYLKTLPDNFVDAVITDPPAGIGFMGKEWDSFGKGLSAREKFVGWLEPIAKECLRVIKPGGHALVWALPKTSHWTATAWENAGWEVRDRIIYCFGSGFPKSLNIGKAIDFEFCKEQLTNKLGRKPTKKELKKEWEDFRIKIEKNPNSRENCDKSNTIYESGTVGKTAYIEEPQTEQAKQWEGWETALKPAVEDWWLLRKPLEKGLNVAENVLKWGTGGLNIDGCRVQLSSNDNLYRKPTECKTSKKNRTNFNTSKLTGSITDDWKKGRFPAHLIHDGSEEVVELFPNSQSHFFYCAKTSRKERDMGLEDIEPRSITGRNEEQDKRGVPHTIRPTPLRNIHPTVKPIKLMEYLVKLITPPNGTVLDPFMGSGSTGIACVNLDKNFIGIEIDEEYFEIAKRRIGFALKQQKLL